MPPKKAASNDIAYCVKCKKKQTMTNAKVVVAGGRRCLKGECKTCGTKMNKFLPNA